MLYAKMITDIVSSCRSGNAISIAGVETPIEKPIVQYNETVWNFVLRMASRLNTVVAPNIRTATPKITFGVPQGDAYNLDAVHYNIGRPSSTYLFKKNFASWSNSFFYEFIDNEHIYSLGDKINIKNRDYIVGAVKIEYLSGEFVNKYHVSTEECYSVRPFWNQKLCGLSLLGTVLDTKPGFIKLHLDIDDSQDISPAYWFEFKSHQGHIFYCMPKLGTRMYLHLQDHDHDIYMVDHCDRTNGLNCCDTQNYHNRYFTSEHGKRMAILPKELFFQTEPNYICLDDSFGVQQITQKQMTLRSAKHLTISSQNKILLSTPEQVLMYKTNTQTGVEISGGEMHFHSDTVNLKGITTATPCKQAAATPKITIKIASNTALKLDGAVPSVNSLK